MNKRVNALHIITITAQVAHEANRAWCEARGDTSQKPWDESPLWQQQSAIQGVCFHIDNPNATDSASHENWMKCKLEEGWVYGELKDPEKKTHPCLVPFEQLPLDQQKKDRLFHSIVHALAMG